MIRAIADRRSRSWLVSVLALFTTVCASAVFAQGSLGMRDTPISHFNAEDTKLMRATADEVLKSTEIGTTRSWQNAATGNSGVITLLASFTSTLGRDCRRLQIDNRAKKASGRTTLNYCRAADGRWLTDPDAQPAPK